MIDIFLKHQQGDFRLSCKFQLPDRGISLVFGRSGAGKSTLLNCLTGLIAAENGHFVLNTETLFDTQQGCSTATHDRSIGMVFQNPRLFPHLTVAKNLKFAKHFDAEKYKQVVEILGISTLLHKRPQQLSGGQQQRVAIGRAVLSSPKLLIMDEPLASLDQENRQRIMVLIKHLANVIGIPVIYVTHQLDEAIYLGDHLVLLDEGKVTASGPLADVWHSPAFEHWNQGQTTTTLLESKVINVDAHYGLVEFTVGQSNQQSIWANGNLDIGQNSRLLIRADDVAVSHIKPSQTSVRNQLTGVITHLCTDKDPASVRLSLNVDGNILYARITRWSLDSLKLAVGQAVNIQVKSVAVKHLSI